MLASRQLLFVTLLTGLMTGAGAAQTPPAVRRSGDAHAVTPPTVTLTTLANLGEAGDGQYGNGPLIQATDGNFYSSTLHGGTNRHGTVYGVSSDGVVTVIGAGDNSHSAVLQATDGYIYSTNTLGGHSGSGGIVGGSIYKTSLSGVQSTFYQFCAERHCDDGIAPYSSVIQAMDGNFYGVTNFGGTTASCTGGCGVLYQLTPAGLLKTVYNFCSLTGCLDGSYPYTGLVQGTDGNFYGTTASGGTNGWWGTIFKITPSGTLTTLYNFPTGISGGALIQASDGSFYGPASASSTVPASVFKITASGKYSTIYSFCSLANCADGTGSSRLVQGTDGNFYGAGGGGTGKACYGSSYGCGVAFMLTPQGVLTSLYNFCPAGGSTCPDGRGPGALVQGTDGNFYGATYTGGTSGYGTVFKLATGLSPFVMTQTSSGKIGSTVVILGNNLTGSTAVTFNHVSASYTVVSSSEITATVPSGATTGSVVVTTPAGKLKSNTSFRISQ